MVQVARRMKARRAGEKTTIRDLISYQLARTASLMSRGAALRYRREFDVSLGEWRALALLAAGEPVLVFPGGESEVYKRRGQEYELLWGKRTGFARMAIEAGCPIVPFAAIGAEDRFRVMLDMDHRVARPARTLVRRLAGRNDIGTLLVRGAGPAGLPGAGRLYFSFSAPIETTRWAGREDDSEALGECRDLVRAAVEREIEQLLALREEDPDRHLLPRAVHAARELMPAAPSVRRLLPVLP